MERFNLCVGCNLVPLFGFGVCGRCVQGHEGHKGAQSELAGVVQVWAMADQSEAQRS